MQFHFRASTAHEGIILIKRQSARLIRTIDIKTYFNLSAQNQLCTMQILHKKVKRYIIQKDQIIHHWSHLCQQSSSLLSLSLESERITDSSKTLHNLKNETSKTPPRSLSLIKWCQSWINNETFQRDVLPQICKIRHATRQRPSARTSSASSVWTDYSLVPRLPCS